jgi:predicted amidohydrolase
MGRKLTVAAIQMDAPPAPVSERLIRAEKLIIQAAQADAQLVVLPEMFNTGYEFHQRNYGLAETLDGKTATWMKAQAARHKLHLVGTLFLLDAQDIYNAALLFAPDGRRWRYDKSYVPLWERAYARGKHEITVADTDIGKIGMLICWDSSHADLWADYAGKIDLMMTMSAPGDIFNGDLVFPGEFRIKCYDLIEPKDPPAEPSTPQDIAAEQAAWIGIPVIEAVSVGVYRTRLPGFEAVLEGSKFADRAEQADKMWLETVTSAAPRILDTNGKILVEGTKQGDDLIIAEIDLPASTPQPKAPQPKVRISQEIYDQSDTDVPNQMIPLYQEGMRNQWGIDS